MPNFIQFLKYIRYILIAVTIFDKIIQNGEINGQCVTDPLTNG